MREHSTAAVGFHFGGRPHKRNYCFVLTSLHQRSGVALPTGGRADPAVGNEALAGTRRSFFFFAGTRRSLVPHTKNKTMFFHTKTNISRTHTDTDGFFCWNVSIRNSLRSNKNGTGAAGKLEACTLCSCQRINWVIAMTKEQHGVIG